MAPNMKFTPNVGALSRYGRGNVKAAMVRGTMALMTKDMVTLPAVRMRLSAAMLNNKLQAMYLQTSRQKVSIRTLCLGFP